MPYVFVLKEADKNLRWKSQGNPKRSTGHEYATVHVTADRPKDILEFQRMCGAEPGANLL